MAGTSAASVSASRPPERHRRTRQSGGQHSPVLRASVGLAAVEASAVSYRRPRRRRSRWRRKTMASCRRCFRRSELMTARSGAIAAALEQEREPEAPADDGNGGGSTAANRLQFLCFSPRTLPPGRPPPREAASSAWFVVRVVAKNEGKDRSRRMLRRREQRPPEATKREQERRARPVILLTGGRPWTTTSFSSSRYRTLGSAPPRISPALKMVSFSPSSLSADPL
jgi:hypothetical protein